MALQRAKRAAVLPLVQRVQQGALGRLFHGWRITSRRRAAVRLAADTCVMQLRRRSLSQTLAVWAAWSAREQHRRFASSLSLNLKGSYVHKMWVAWSAPFETLQ